MFNDWYLVALDDLPKWLNMNNQFLCDVVLEEARRAVIAIPKKSGIEGLMIHMDSCKVHNSAKTTKRQDVF
jgi:hypothetical protein